MTGKNALAARKRAVQGGLAPAENKKISRTVSQCHPSFFACFFFFLSKPNAC
jgi:hypothetical protein